ncbi:sigma-70 family RNA polymerase sigma factor [Amycolatopsis sp. NPDC051102]|uniref:RNA polymerase sigma factor n=1 Tax=Amycolatopsis sp. NPDC051102 TaxID=3155163 RepID=UPI00344496AF
MTDPDPVEPSAASAATSDKHAHQTAEAINATFTAFYRDHIKALVALLLVQGASLTTAADIAQETMTAAYKNWAQIKHPKAWTRTAAVRTFIRHKLNTREDVVEKLPEPTSLLRHDIALERWEQRQDLLSELEGLSHRQRHVVALFLDDMSAEQIAHDLDITPGAVREHLSQARRYLRNQLDPKDGES